MRLCTKRMDVDAQLICLHTHGKTLPTPENPCLVASHPAIGSRKDVQLSLMVKGFVKGLSSFTLYKTKTLLHAFDLLYKYYHVFCVDYPEDLKKFFFFIEEFCYDTKKFGILENSALNDRIQAALRRLQSQSMDLIDPLQGL